MIGHIKKQVSLSMLSAIPATSSSLRNFLVGIRSCGELSDNENLCKPDLRALADSFYQDIEYVQK